MENGEENGEQNENGESSNNSDNSNSPNNPYDSGSSFEEGDHHFILVSSEDLDHSYRCNYCSGEITDDQQFVCTHFDCEGH